MSTQVAADLRAAADVLRRDGWRQGYLGVDRRPKCALGCLSAAIGGRPSVVFRDDELFERYEAAWTVLRDQVGYPPAVWNDRVARTADEVIAALLAAADAAEAQP